MNGVGLRHVILLAAIAITSKWEVAYGHRLDLGVLAWALPLLTSGYLWLAMDRRSRLDVALSVAAVTCSAVLGSISAVVSLPAVALAVWTALLVALVLYRTHVIDDDLDDRSPVAGDDLDDDAGDVVPVAVDVDPPARPVAVEARPVAPVEVEAPAARPTADELGELELEHLFTRRQLAGDPMSVDEVHALRGGTRDAARAWRRRMSERTSR